MEVFVELKKIKGIGDKTEQSFNRLGIFRAEDLLTYYPRRYEKFSLPVTGSFIRENGCYALECIFKTSLKMTRTNTGKIIITGTAYDRDGISISVKWFNMPYLTKTIKAGVKYVLYGMYEREKFITVNQPKVYKPNEYMLLTNNLQPVYPLKSGINNNTLKKAIKTAYEMDVKISDPLDEKLALKYELYEKNYALRQLHFPKDEETLIKARKRISFDDFFTFFARLRILRECKVYEKNNYCIEPHDKTLTLMENLPFKLTKAQSRTIKEIFADMKSGTVMTRLVQGDVGSGKTIVAFLAMLNTAFAGYQSALMVPTEVLANQHYESIKNLLDVNNLDVSVVLLTGSMSAKEKKNTLAKISDGNADIIIGTHALISENVKYYELALAVTDEQHRFGVKQRDDFGKKGYLPHSLIMSATPIPRTLAKMIYGDMSVSIIDTMPTNRLPIKNAVVNESYRARCYKLIFDEIKAGHQAYIICPMVDENEEIDALNVISHAQELKTVFCDNIKIAYLHGKMSSQEKEDIMAEFSAGKIHILVATTVIEVGINVPNATVIMIENAERFGLSQLHQLRGRVGRGSAQSYCLFMNGNETEESKERLGIIGKTNNGFEIAEADLKHRGPGDIFGVKQSGEMLFTFGDMFSDSDILELAKEAAESLPKNELDKYVDKACFYLT